MKKIFFYAAALCTVAVSCKKEQTPESGLDVNAGTNAILANVTLPTIISSNMTLTPANVYKLNGKVFVTNGAVLTIQAGTRVEGIYKKNIGGTVPPDSASALVITKNGTIQCLGGQNSPVIFTSDIQSKRDSLANPSAVREPGDWGGVVILGNAITNKPATQFIEGINPAAVPAGVDVTYGGGATNGVGSGRIFYTRVEYAGAAIAANNELNSLTFGGVGNLTTVRFVQCSKGADDAFEFFGGAVNTFFTIANSQNDDAYDYDFGYRGITQFAVSVRGSAFTYNDANGIECDNENPFATCSTPFTQPTITNMTIVGACGAALPGTLDGARFRRRTGLIMRNSIIMGYNRGVAFDNVNPRTIVAAFKNNAVSYLGAIGDSASYTGTDCAGLAVTGPWGTPNRILNGCPPNNPNANAWVNIPIPATLAQYKSGALAYKLGGPLDPTVPGASVPDYVGLSANVIRSPDINYIGAIGQGGYVNALDPGNWIAGSAAAWVNFDPL